MLSIYHGLARLPLPLLYGLSSILSWLVYHVLRYRRETVAANLAAAFPEWSASQRRAMAKRFYQHLCDLGVEVLASYALPQEQLRRRVSIDNPELLEPFRQQRRPMLLLTCHQGNWEWLQHVLAEHMDCPVNGVYKALHNPVMDRFILECRTRSGAPIPFKDAGREILRGRRQYRIFAMLADQAPFKRDKRYWHDFLGRPGSFYLGPQTIAELSQYPVLFVRMIKTRRGHYRAHFEVLALPPHAKGGHAILDRYIETLERAIRAQPETWLWSNRKWKHKPPEEIDQAAAATDSEAH
jgi:Kdo2-lipid IVA lauroyltransferase/acyltransferase